MVGTCSRGIYALLICPLRTHVGHSARSRDRDARTTYDEAAHVARAKRNP